MTVRNQFVATISLFALAAPALGQSVTASQMDAALLAKAKAYLAKATSPVDQKADPQKVTSYLVVKIDPPKVTRTISVQTEDAPQGFANCTDKTMPGGTYTMSVSDTKSSTVTVTETTTAGMTDKVSASVDGIGAEFSASLSEALSMGTSQTNGETITVSRGVATGPLEPGEGVKFVGVQSQDVYVNEPYTLYVQPLYGDVVVDMGMTKIPQSVDFTTVYSPMNFAANPPLVVNAIMNGKNNTEADVLSFPLSKDEVQVRCAAGGVPGAPARPVSMSPFSGPPGMFGPGKELTAPTRSR